MLMVIGVLVALVIPAEAQAKAPKKCADLVATAQEISDLFDDYFAASDEFQSVPEGDPSEIELLAELDRVEGEMRSIRRLLKRDTKKCAA
jgi:hypothetical protein